MNEITRLDHVFEGRHFTTITLDGQNFWIARELGAVAEYAGNGRRLVSKIAKDSEFVPGKDYVIVRGDTLACIKETLRPDTETVPGRTASLMLLTESGLHLALARAKTPEGRRLRRFVADEVMPQLVRTGAYSPDRRVVDGVVVVVDLPAPSPARRGLAEDREARLALQALTRERQVDLKDRVARADALRQLGSVVADDDARAALQVAAAEIVTGADLSRYKPEVGRWSSPTELALRWGITVQRLGRVITTVGLRGDPRFSKQVVSKARTSDRVVITFLYNSDAEATIEAALREAGLLPSDDEQG